MGRLRLNVFCRTGNAGDSGGFEKWFGHITEEHDVFSGPAAEIEEPFMIPVPRTSRSAASLVTPTQFLALGAWFRLGTIAVMDRRQNDTASPSFE
jgi:hypothetical protein